MIVRIALLLWFASTLILAVIALEKDFERKVPDWVQMALLGISLVGLAVLVFGTRP